MEIILKVYYINLSIFVLLFTIRALLALTYWIRNNPHNVLSRTMLSKVSIIQPILSGDKNLSNALSTNITQTPEASFIWIIDKEDIKAETITKKIMNTSINNKKRIQVITTNTIPHHLNPKIYKLALAFPYNKKPYTLVLDDDTTIDTQKLSSMLGLAKEQSLVTALPVYLHSSGLWSQLVTAFVNSNSFFTYLSMALLEKPKTINGMCYIASTSDLKALNAFKNIEDKLCDDLEIATLYIKNKMSLVQSTIPCNIRTTVQGFKHYLKLMKRWMVFANNYLKSNISVNAILLIILPSFLPMLLLITSFLLGTKYLSIFVLTHILKASIYSAFRKYILKTNETFINIIYELFSDYLQVVHYIHATISSKEIHWRKHNVKLNNKRIQFNP